MDTPQKFLITVVGPTAIGKTALAIKIARHFNCEIISADSRQFYREMTIGTAVPDEDELASVPHHFIHNKSIHENYTVGDFEKEALSKLDELFMANDFAVMVGGSGLYIDAVLKGFDDFPDIDESVKKAVAENYALEGIDWLRGKLKDLDPEYLGMVDASNPQRMMRAVEVSISSGMPYSSFLSNNKKQRHFQPVLLGINAEREVIYSRINDRVDVMIKNGLLDEARQLYAHKDLNALQTVGYRELFRYFDKDISIEVAIDDIKKNTRRFAKRQMTWFRKYENIKWFGYFEEETIIDHIAKMTQ